MWALSWKEPFVGTMPNPFPPIHILRSGKQTLSTTSGSCCITLKRPKSSLKVTVRSQMKSWNKKNGLTANNPSEDGVLKCFKWCALTPLAFDKLRAVGLLLTLPTLPQPWESLDIMSQTVDLVASHCLISHVKLWLCNMSCRSTCIYLPLALQLCRFLASSSTHTHTLQISYRWTLGKRMFRPMPWLMYPLPCSIGSCLSLSIERICFKVLRVNFLNHRSLLLNASFADSGGCTARILGEKTADFGFVGPEWLG